VNRIIREEMNAIGGQEISMPVLHPAEVWQQSGRWYDIGDEMFRLKDRNQRDMVLGMTHEEIIAWLAAREIRSYRDLPQVWYQIQTKLRDEARPKSGVLRTREFLMKDSYTLDLDAAGLDQSYQLHYEAYVKIFRRCGVKFYAVESDPGMMGGAGAHEFMAPSEAGEDEVALCETCGYAANVELAQSSPVPPAFPAWKLEEVATPDSRTIEEVCAYLGISPRLTIKSLLLMADDKPVMALIRGDQQLHEKKIQVPGGEFRPAHREEVKEFTGVEAGFLGPAHFSPPRPIPIVADISCREVSLLPGQPGRVPFAGGRAGTALLRPVRRHSPGHVRDACPKCQASLKVEKTIEIATFSSWGPNIPSPQGLYLDHQGQEKPIVMGSYGIGAGADHRRRRGAEPPIKTASSSLPP